MFGKFEKMLYLCSVKDEGTTAGFVSNFTRDVCEQHTYFWPTVHVMFHNNTRDNKRSKELRVDSLKWRDSSQVESAALRSSKLGEL